MANDPLNFKKGKQLTPNPPQDKKNKNFSINPRQKFLNSSSSINTILNDNESDCLNQILDTSNSSRPLSSRLSKYSVLPDIGANLIKPILIGLRLPNGLKKEKEFKYGDKLDHVLEYAVNELGKSETKQNIKFNKSNFTLLQMPNTTFNDLNKTIQSYEIQNRSMIFLIEKKLL